MNTKEKDILSVQDLLRNAGEYSCLALVYAFFAEKMYEPDFNPTVFASKVKLILDILDGWNSSLLDDEYFVKDANKYLSYLCPEIEWKVTKKDIKSIKDLVGTVGAVRFDYDGKSHWVAQANGSIIYDTLTHSWTRYRGKPVTARIIEAKEKESK